MPKKQKPQKSDSHNNSERSHNNLKSVFPENWNIASLEDVFSKFEYGQDWLVQIVLDNGEVTSAEFRVQSKVFTTAKQVKGSSLKARIKVSTLNYLYELTSPVIIHYYDFVNKMGYWIWLHEWYTKNYSTDWEEREEVEVTIPKSSILDASAVTTITEYVNNHHRVYSSIEMAWLVSQHNNDFSIKVEKSDDGVHFSFSPKHANAQFKVVTDAEGLHRLKHNYNTGEEVSFAGRIKVNKVFDQFFEKIFGNNSRITINTKVDQELLLQIQFLDSEDNIIVVIPLVRMRTVNYGTQRVVMEGVYEQIKYTLSSDSSKREVKLNISFSIGSEDLIGLAKGFELFEKVIKSKKTKIQNLEKPEIPILWDNGSSILDMPFPEPEIRLIKALAILQSKLNINLQVPDVFDDYLLYNIEGIAEGIRDGKTQHLVGVTSNEVILTMETSDPQKMLDDLAKGNTISAKLPMPEDSAIITIFDKEIDVGQRFIEFEQAKMQNLKAITELLLTAKEGEPIEFDIIAEIDRTKARMIFADWPKREKFDSALSQVADVEPIEGDEI